MKTNVEKLKKSSQLGAVRQRLGADNENDKSCDAQINKMSSHAVVRAVCGWHYGDGNIWGDLKSLFDELEQNNE